MDDERWAKVDGYLEGLLGIQDQTLAATLAASTNAGLPAINVSATQGKFLQLLATSHRARRILEIGTLGGYSTTWLARSLPDDGMLISLELDAHHANVARENLDRAGLAALVDVRVGPATTTLRDLISSLSEPFDFIFIDADKEGYAEYFSLSLQLSRPGTVMVVDNVVRDGAIIDELTEDERVKGVQEFLTLVASTSSVEATVIQTVGTKGYDGFALVLVS
jgi:predicted O-methyltransferase YrrM